MATLKDTILSDVEDIFLNTDEFAEVIGYKPANSDWIYIAANVERDNLVSTDTEVGVVAVRYQVAVDISMASVPIVSAGQDLVFLSAKEGDEPAEWVVLEIAGQNDGMWSLTVGEA